MRSIAVAAFAALLSLAAGSQATAQRAEGGVNPSDPIDPELRAELARPHSIPKAKGLAEYQSAGGALRFSERTIDGLPGQPAVRVVIVEPKKARAGRGGLLYIHGGGYVAGTAEENIPNIIAPLSEKLGITIVSVEYRLAPGTHFPGPLYDNYAALKWFYDNAAGMGVDSKRIGVYGGSAGGGHVVALSVYARDRGEVSLLFQAVYAPMLDDRTGGVVEPGQYFGQHDLTTNVVDPEKKLPTSIRKRASVQYGWKALLNMEPGGPGVPAAAAPARFDDLHGLPPTIVSVGSLDIFAPESIRFALRLMQAGVRTDLHVYGGAFHGSVFLVPAADVSRREQAELEAWMGRAYELSAKGMVR